MSAPSAWMVPLHSVYITYKNMMFQLDGLQFRFAVCQVASESDMTGEKW